MGRGNYSIRHTSFHLYGDVVPRQRVEEEQVEGTVSNKYILNSVYYYNVRVILY